MNTDRYYCGNDYCGDSNSILNNNFKHHFETLLISNQWDLRRDKILSKIHCLININNEYFLENYSHIIENEEFFRLLIRDIFLFVYNETDLLNHLNINKLKEIPMMIYRIAKVSFSTLRAVYREKEFLEKISNLYGFIYLSTNQATETKKVYVGQCFRTIKIEWGSILTRGRALIRKKRNKEKIMDRNLKRYIVRAIAKYGTDVWKLELINIAYSKSELDIKETYYIVEIYDSMNPEKGYNLTKGGASGKPSGDTIQSQSRAAKEMWQRPGMKEKISKSIKEAWQTPEYRKKQSEIMKKIATKPDNIEKRSRASKKLWNRIGQKEKIISAKKEAYKNDPKYRERLDKARKKANKARRIEIQDVKQFLIDVKNSSRWVEVVRKYPFKSRDTLNARLKEILKPFGIRNYTMAKKFLECREINDILGGLRDFRSWG